MEGRAARLVVPLVFVQELLALLGSRHLVSAASAHRHIHMTLCFFSYHPCAHFLLYRSLDQWAQAAALTPHHSLPICVSGDNGGFLYPPAHWTEDAPDWTGHLEE